MHLHRLRNWTRHRHRLRSGFHGGQLTRDRRPQHYHHNRKEVSRHCFRAGLLTVCQSCPG